MKYVALIFTLLFSACSVKDYKNSEAKIIIIKTPKLKFSDLGYVRYSGDAIELELFSAGKVVQKIAINHLICLNEGCMSKGGFNREYLNAAYPDSLLQNLFRGKPIYDGLNTSKTYDGFEQRIKTHDVDVIYRVDTQQIFFKDRANNIIVKIKQVG